jgi:hypothetical protein
VLVAMCTVYPAVFQTVSANNSRDADEQKTHAWLASEAQRSTVREVIPSEYRKRYQQWKTEYLSTAAGRSQWQLYALNPNFTLTITVSKEEGQGARVKDFTWNENGHLLAATIVLGNKLDSGYPSSINYPVTCSLAPGNLPPEVKGKILAATKLAHEFGHLGQVNSISGTVYQMQNVLMTEYLRIFNSNSFDVHDARLIELAEQMGGTPVSIKQEREHWAEASAITYLTERLPQLSKRSKIPSSIRQAIDAYYSTYPERFQTANQN